MPPESPATGAVTEVVEGSCLQLAGQALPLAALEQIFYARGGWPDGPDDAEQLSPEHRTALEHLYFRDQSLAQAAAELGVPRNTVRSRAYHALRALRAAMKPPAEGDQL